MGRPKKKLKGRKKSKKIDEEPVPVEPDQQEDQQHQTQAEPDHLEETENVRISTGQMSDKRVNDDEEPEGEVELDEDDVYANTFKDAKCNKFSFLNSSSTEQSRGDKSAAKGHDQSTSRGSKSCDATSPAAGPKTHVEKSPTVEKSPARKTQVPSQSPTRRSPRKQGAQVIKENQKCMLMDIRGGKRIIAEGRVHSTNPEQKVHCIRLGANAARVWVDIVKIDDAAVWRPSDEMEIIKDALGSSIAWPMDKLVIF